MTDIQKFQRVCRVFLARLLMVHGKDAPKYCGASRMSWNGWGRKGLLIQVAAI